jgi:LETM1 and EF-hand domain-containing protein 1
MLIQREGVASLSEHELRQACRERGHLGLFPVEEMREEVISYFFSYYTTIICSYFIHNNGC